MTESEKKKNADDPDEIPGNAEDFVEERLLEFTDEAGGETLGGEVIFED